MAATRRVGFLGAGRMATALAKGFVKAGILDADALCASDPSSEAGEHFARETGGRILGRNEEVLGAADTLVLAVKPDQVRPVLDGIAPSFTKDHLLISIAAGVRLRAIAGALPAGARIVRVMPNTPALIQCSASGYSPGDHVTPQDSDWVQRLFSAVGEAFPVKETLLDAVTGLSGSGPAYVYLMIDALSDGGVAAGLPREAATRLAAQTVLGSARMVLETGMHPGSLKDMVTSPGGTTIEGIHQLEIGGVRAALINAVRAAARRARELGGD